MSVPSSASSSSAGNQVEGNVRGDNQTSAPEKFDEANADPEGWLESVEKFLDQQRLTEDQKVLTFFMLLKGAAAEWFTRLAPADRDTFFQVKWKFKIRFGRTASLRHLKIAELFKQKQGQDKSEQYIERVRTLARELWIQDEDVVLAAIWNGLRMTIQNVLLTKGQTRSLTELTAAARVLDETVEDELRHQLERLVDSLTAQLSLLTVAEEGRQHPVKQRSIGQTPASSPHVGRRTWSSTLSGRHRRDRWASSYTQRRPVNSNARPGRPLGTVNDYTSTSSSGYDDHLNDGRWHSPSMGDCYSLGRWEQGTPQDTDGDDELRHHHEHWPRQHSKDTLFRVDRIVC